MDEKSKRLAAAKKKLHQYKTQRQKQERVQNKTDPLNRSQESLGSSFSLDDEENTTTTITTEEESSSSLLINASLESEEIQQQQQQPLQENNLQVKYHEIEVSNNNNKTLTIVPLDQSSNQIEKQRETEEKEEEEKYGKETFLSETVNEENLESTPIESQLPSSDLIITSFEQDQPLVLTAVSPPTTTIGETMESPVPILELKKEESYLTQSPEVAFYSLNNNNYDNNKKEGQLDNKETVEKCTQCESSEAESKAQENFNDVIDNLQFELSKLRKENSTLLSRESELIQQLETGEKLVRDLRKEVNQFRQQGNQQRQLEELQDAIVVLSKSKMTIAEELNNEQDKNKELLDNLGTYENELKSLRSENSRLWADMNNVKAMLEAEQKKNQVLEDQKRQYGNQVVTLQSKLSSLENSNNDPHHHHDHHHHDENSHHGECHEHGHDEHHHHHNGAEDDHHHHDHHDDHHHGDNTSHSHSSDDINHELTEMKKTLKRVNWENETYKAELAKLGPLKQLEPRFQELQLKNAALKEEIDRLEHLVIQLQGENDTIGDYITLYQTQRIALRQHAKENDQLVAALSKERNDLLQKLSELNHAVDRLATEKGGSVIIEDKIRDLITDVNSKVNETFSCSTCSGSRLMTV